MRAYLARDSKPLWPLPRPAGEITLGPTTLRQRLSSQLTSAGFDVEEIDSTRLGEIRSPALVCLDHVFISDRLLRAFVAHARTAPGSTRCRVDSTDQYALSLVGAERRVSALDIFFLREPDFASAEWAEFKIDASSAYILPVTLPSPVSGPGRFCVHFTNQFGLNVTRWFDLLTAATLHCRELTARTVGLAKKLLPAAWVNHYAEKPFLTRRLNDIGKRCRIHPTAVLESCVIGDGVEIGPYCYLRASVVAANAVIREQSSLKLTYLGRGSYLMPCDLFNCYIGDESAIVTQMIYNCVIGDRSFIGGGSGFADFQIDRRSIRVELPEGEVDSGLTLLGSAVGDECFIGAGLIFHPGRAIPSRSKILNTQTISSVPQQTDQIYAAEGNLLLKVPKAFVSGRN